MACAFFRFRGLPSTVTGGVSADWIPEYWGKFAVLSAPARGRLFRNSIVPRVSIGRRRHHTRQPILQSGTVLTGNEGGRWTGWMSVCHHRLLTYGELHSVHDRRVPKRWFKCSFRGACPKRVYLLRVRPVYRLFTKRPIYRPTASGPHPTGIGMQLVLTTPNSF